MIGSLGTFTSLHTSTTYDRAEDTWGSRFPNSPPAVKQVVHQYLQRVWDLLYLITAPQAILAYTLADNGLLKGISSTVLSLSHVEDLSYIWLQREVPEAVGGWLRTNRREKDATEERLVAEFHRKAWPTAVERALIRTSIVQAWSAFEALAGDMWIAAVDARPDPLLHRALGNQKIKLEDLKKIIALADGSLGATVGRKMGMTNTDRILAAYDSVFQVTSIPGISPLQRELVHLEKARHLLVHRGGIIDDEYIKAVGVGTTGAQFALTLNETCALANAGISAGNNLINFVMRWFDPLV